MARLRHRLGTAATPAPIVTRPPGYAIELRPHQLDSLHFREDAEAALHPYRDGDGGVAVPLAGHLVTAHPRLTTA